MFHNQKRTTTTGNYDKHILALQDLIDACKHRQASRTLIDTYKDNIRILELMSANKPITWDEFEQVTKLHDVRVDAACFCYSNIVDTPKP